MTAASKRHLVRKLDNVETFPLIALQALHELRPELDHVEARAITRARELGASLEDIAEAMGITRQGVAYRLKTIGERGGADEPIVEVPDVEGESAGT
jgi:hypothetical protein